MSRPPSPVSVYHVNLYSSTEWGPELRAAHQRRAAWRWPCVSHLQSAGLLLRGWVTAGYSPSTFNTPPTRMAWHGSEALHRFEIQHRINIVRVSYVNVSPHLTLNMHRRGCLGLFQRFTGTYRQTGTEKTFLGMTIRCVKELGSSERTQTCS